MSKLTKYILLALYNHEDKKVGEYEWVGEVERHIQSEGHYIKGYSRERGIIFIHTESENVFYSVKLKIKFQEI